MQEEKQHFKRILCNAAEAKQHWQQEVHEAEQLLEIAKENLEKTETEMIQAEKCLAMLNEVKSIKLQKLELGGF